MRRLAVLLALWLALPLTALAQNAPNGAALLVADSVVIDSEGRLIASGAVEALHDGNRLTAARITYDPDGETLDIAGPLRLTLKDGTVLISDQAQLDAGFRNGLLRGARMVLDDQLQLAAVEARRVDGTLTALNKVAVTSCQVCANGTPLWQIRASRVVHDQEAQQLYFDNAQFRILDVPVLYLPRLRLPDPTLKRARGFLIPELRSETRLGFGLKLPYFIPLGDHADLTLTPYVSTVTRTLEYRIRRAFRTGDIEINGAVSDDGLTDNAQRAYLFADGSFVLPRAYRLRFAIQAVSDDTYLSDYDYGDNDRLESNLLLDRVQRDHMLSAGVFHFQSLRDTEDNATQATIVADTRYQRRIPLQLGELRVGAVAHAHYRYSDLAVDGPDDDSVVDGRDVARLSADLSYVHRVTLTGGVRLGVEGRLWADGFRIDQDDTSDARRAQITPAARLELRWPWVKRTPNGARVLLEPVAQVGWMGGDRPKVANDESTRVEFDEGNLLALSRFPATDRRERGRSGVVGLRWLREDPGGWSAGLTLGRVWRDQGDAAFSKSSGLQTTRSDWMMSGQLRLQNGFSLTGRWLLDDDLDASKAEARASWQAERFGLDATYLLLVEDPAEDRDKTLSEWNLSGTYDLNRHWTARANWRYDLAADQFAKAGLGLNYRNECVDVGLRVSRRFASSTNVESSTSFGLTVALKGFSTGGSAKDFRRTCSN